MKGGKSNGAPARSGEMIWRRIEDKVVLISKDGRALHVLNRTAAEIWELCDGENGVDAIVGRLCEQFDPDGIDIEADVRKTLARFSEIRALNDVPNISKED